MSNRPVIGIVPTFDDGKMFSWHDGAGRIYLRHEYLQQIVDAGATPLVIHPAMALDDIIMRCSGIVISGGEDIDPKFYGQDALVDAPGYEPHQRFEWERHLIDACDRADVPILGVCYGMQRLNVHYGGTLLQDIPTLLPQNIGHNQTEHEVTFTEPLLGLDGTWRVASRHHQAIGTLADGFRVVAVAPDGVIEAVAGRGHSGVQWHTESDATGVRIYRAFVDDATRRTR